MRLWSISPSYLDSKGLVALWRESLLAQNVLTGNTRGYKNHPQLLRFLATTNPAGAIATYLRAIAREADLRGYHFDAGKIINKRYTRKIPVTSGQIRYEFDHLLRKLKKRSPEQYKALKNTRIIKPHSLFYITKGSVETWEKVQAFRPAH